MGGPLFLIIFGALRFLRIKDPPPLKTPKKWNAIVNTTILATEEIQNLGNGNTLGKKVVYVQTVTLLN